MRGMNLFFSLLGVLILLKFGIAFFPVDPESSAANVLSLVFTPLLIAIPVYAIFGAADHKWDWLLALQFIGIGLLLHIPLSFVEKMVEDKVILSALSAIGQSGLLIWTTGLGALLAVKLRDRNMLIPISIFLVAFDIFLVFNPSSPMQKLLEANPNYLPTIAYKIPTVGSVNPFAFIGPADFLFMGMFFVALYRFEMSAKTTMRWMIVAILAYLLLSFLTHSLPLMVPIGITVLIINWKHFSMNKEEILSTFIIAGICALLIGWAAWRASQAGISSEGRDSAPEGSELKPAPGAEGQYQLESQTAPTGTPSPP